MPFETANMFWQIFKGGAPTYLVLCFITELVDIVESGFIRNSETVTCWAKSERERCTHDANCAQGLYCVDGNCDRELPANRKSMAEHCHTKYLNEVCAHTIECQSHLVCAEVGPTAVCLPPNSGKEELDPNLPARIPDSGEDETSEDDVSKISDEWDDIDLSPPGDDFQPVLPFKADYNDLEDLYS